MLEELKSRAASFLSRSSDAPLSIREAKGITDTFTPVSIASDDPAKRMRIFGALGSGVPAWSGETVTLNTAMALSVVYACTRIIAETKGFLPLKLRRRKGNMVEDAVDHPLYSALLYEPNAEISGQGFGELLTQHCVLRGGGFAQVVRRSGVGTAIEVNELLPDNVLVTREKAGQKRLVYVVREANQPDRSYTVVRDKPQDIFHLRGLGWDGITGYSVLAMARQSMGTAIAQERNVAAFYANGGRVPYTLSMDKHYEDPNDYKRFREDWSETYRNPHMAPILIDGMKYQQIGLSAADAQLIESRQFTIPELCRWFLVSPHMVGDLSRATFSNIESLADQFLRFTLMTWLNRWEQDGRRCLLTPEEKSQGYFLDHDLQALLRSAWLQRVQGWAALLQNGVMNRDEVRAAEGMNPIPDGSGSEYTVQVNMTTLGKVGEAEAAPAKPDIVFGDAKE